MENKDVYELTNPQKSIWYMEEFFKGSNINNICGNITITINKPSHLWTIISTI